MLQLDHCPICNQSDVEYYYTGKSMRVEGQSFDLHICKACEHYFMNPQPTWEELDVYYAASYDPYSADHGMTDLESTIEAAKTSKQYRHVPAVSGMKVLDIGCGGGSFLRVMSGVGVDVFGIEPSSHGVEACRSSNLPVFHGDLTEYIEKFGTDNKFDLITANHVVEHHPDPVTFLSEMRKLLNEDGVIWFSVPNAGYHYAKYLRDKWHSLDLPYHLMQFNKNSADILIEKSGLTKKKIYTYSLESALASTFKTYIRHKYYIPIRLSDKLPFLVEPIARSIGKKLDQRCEGEALIVEATL